MQIFLMGKTKTGKTTISQLLKKEYSQSQIYEAGAWAREEFQLFYRENFDEYSNDFKNKLTEFALQKLRKDSLYSFKKYKEWKMNNKNQITLISGVRNPDDFIHMLEEDKNNIIIFIDTQKSFSGALELFEKGLTLIENYVLWKKELGVNIPIFNITDKDIEDKNLTQLILFIKEHIDESTL